MIGYADALRSKIDRTNRANALNEMLAISIPRVELAVATYLDTSGIDFDQQEDGDVELLILDDLGLSAGIVLPIAKKMWEYATELFEHVYDITTDVSAWREKSVVNEILGARTPVLILAYEQSHLGERIPKAVTNTRFAQVDADLVHRIADLFWPGGEKMPVRDWEPNISDILVALKGAKTREAYYESIRSYDAYVAPEDVKAHVPTAQPLSKMSGFGEAQDWGMQLVEDLRAYRAGERAWADMDVGVLLSSPPGGGKTTFARSLAAECGLPFFPTGYTDWAGGNESSGDTIAKKLTKLFAEWRKAAPCIVFVDEIDSIGKRGMDWRQDYWFGPIINAWLAFLDGAVTRDGIVVIAATNYPDRVDDAMKRPGRLDRHIRIPMPDAEAIAGMVYHHLGADLDESEVVRAARALRGRNPSQIMQVCKDARRIARKEGRVATAADVLRVMPPSHLTEEDDRVICVHEAGHAVVALETGWPLASVDADRAETECYIPDIVRLPEFLARSRIPFGGRAAEHVVLGEIGIGSGADLESATLLARKWLFRMGGAGLTSMSVDSPISSPMLAQVEAWLQDRYAEAIAIVERRRADVVRIADALRTRRYLTGEEVTFLLAYRERFRRAVEAGYDERDRYWGEVLASDPRQMAA